MLQAGTVPQTEISAGTLATSSQSYSLSFNASSGSFTLTGTGSPPELFQIFVTEPNTSVTITCTDGLTFAVGAGSPVFWLPTNTLQDPVIESFSETSVELSFPTPPLPSDRIGFALSTQFAPASGPVVNNLQPLFFVTAEFLAPPVSLDLLYVPADGSFRIEGTSLTQDPLMQAQVCLRLGMVSSNQGGGPVQVNLITAGAPPNPVAVFASPAVVFTNPSTQPINPTTPTMVEISIPFNNGLTVGLNFVIQYNGVTIFSPDPIIVDKTIGSNPGPGT